MVRLASSFFALLSMAAVWACGGKEVAGDAEDIAVDMAGIIGGVPVTAYKEAAILDMISAQGAHYACTAALIAPKVVLTAGHCVDGMVAWTVYVQGSARSSTRAETYDWNENGATTVNPAHHDIGLVYLSNPIALSLYPTIATAPVASGTRALNVGRVKDGVMTSSLFEAPVTLAPGSTVGFPFDYTATNVIEHGDSGGPVFVQGTHTLVAVNSGAGNGIEVLARVDLLASWIASRIAANGGAGAGTPVDAGAPNVPSIPNDAGTSGACPADVEPNDNVSRANALGAQACGVLRTSTDIDWYRFVAKVGTTTLTITGSDDASMYVGYVAKNTCVGFFGGITSVNMIVKSGAPVLCVGVSSASNQRQSYRLTRAD